MEHTDCRLEVTTSAKMQARVNQALSAHEYKPESSTIFAKTMGHLSFCSYFDSPVKGKM